MTRLPTSSSAVLSILGLAWTSSCTAQAQPGDDLKIHADLLQACPQARSQLKGALGYLVDLHGEEGLMHVSFVLAGREISNVHTRLGPRQYAPQVRRAIEALQCQGPSGAAQLHRLELNFRNVDRGRGAG